MESNFEGISDAPAVRPAGMDDSNWRALLRQLKGAKTGARYLRRKAAEEAQQAREQLDRFLRILSFNDNSIGYMPADQQRHFNELSAANEAYKNAPDLADAQLREPTPVSKSQQQALPENKWARKLMATLSLMAAFMLPVANMVRGQKSEKFEAAVKNEPYVVKPLTDAANDENYDIASANDEDYHHHNDDQVA